MLESILGYSITLPGWITFGLPVLAALLLAIAIWWLWWRWPKRKAARLGLTDPKDRAEVEDNYRKTVGQAIGGIAVLLGAASAYLQFSQQQQAAHDLLISTQVSKGFEQLGSEKVVVRLGGIYALEGVMNGSGQYHQPVLEALTAFVREGAKLPATAPTPGPPTQKPPTDIQAALTVIGRRSEGSGFVDLTNANIAGADVSGDLKDGDLRGANLTHAFMFLADLSGADLRGTSLTGADLRGANLTGALVTGASLRGADLRGANLTRDDLSDADLSDAKLEGANLTDTHLTGARALGQKQLDEACGSNAMLPTGLTLKPCQP